LANGVRVPTLVGLLPPKQKTQLKTAKPAICLKKIFSLAILRGPTVLTLNDFK
jgi:hypothetical protein